MVASMNKGLTDEQWKLVQDKYGNLIVHAANRIYFDKYLYSVEDSIQELNSMLIKGMLRFCEFENTVFDVAWHEPGFHKYIKAIIWNSKNAIGLRIRKSCETPGGVLVPRDSRVSLKVLEYRSNMEDKGEEYPYSIQDKLLQIPHESILNSIKFDPKEQQLIKLAMEDYGFFKPNNRLHVTKLAKELNTTNYEINKLITSIKNKIQEYL